ncbi:MAG: 4Fe-4S binding protein [Bacteroidota bacterium]|nr:4Fe-4S binding protein [Bacteroidota bacterium]
MVKRKIIKIDESLCDGCALCIPSCPEGALQIIDGKAKLVKESFCDGLGACLGDCPQGALTIVEAETDQYDEHGVIEHIKTNTPEKLHTHIEHMNQHKNEMNRHSQQLHFGGCPSSRVMQFEEPSNTEPSARTSSQLRQWPIQLHLVPPTAPYFQNANIFLVADCVPFAYSNFHSDILAGNAIAICCPKLDDVNEYVEKVAQIFRHSMPKSIKVAIMEVPCCSGLVQIAHQASIKAGLNIPIEVVVIGIRGNLIGKKTIQPLMKSVHNESSRC